jgi:hypothetical protein|tara:strand:+ start:25261 stop:25644 length:384 start_codon:yes stop_codon:yes gene_type:complete
MLKKQILEFALKYWKEILVILMAAVVILKMNHDYYLMQTSYETRIESAQAQIEGLKEIHKKELQEKQILMESFLQSMAAIEDEYSKAQIELDELQRKKKQDYTKKFRQDKKQLIKDIETTFGIQYVP